ncbi:peptidase S1 [Cellulomonas sp. Root485]|uniref:S1C family serine protease n=1 Tax=Cellulomonas sp. Root485 TaxID=1736546 RepID=UPI0006FE4855|nr:trypsin-like peptidase domain-containing protein [Cellulomonas sp. Root485]KQY23441.1 peptidase S1 [Cellulomonas sp. Root485]
MTNPDDGQPVAVPAGQDPEQAPASPFASPSGRRELPPTPPTPTPDQAPSTDASPADGDVTPASAAAPTAPAAPTPPAPHPPGTHWSVPHGSVPSFAPPSPSVPSNPYGPVVQQPVPAPWAGIPYVTTGTTAAAEPLPGQPGVPHTVVLHRKRRRTLSAAWVVPLVIIALAAGAVGGVVGSRLTEDDHLADAGLPLAPVGAGPVERAPGSVAGIAAGVLPSVVSIQVDGPEGSATGSGFVLRGDGYLVTNNHVIAQADGAASTTITVTFVDGSEQDASIVGRTADYDLAVLKVDADGLTPLLLGDSDAVVVGDPVVAVGAPLGLAGTVTTGIVSALNRPVSAGEATESDDQAFINAIQTDAAINPGNSGGPLVNAAGEVIGINSAIAQPPGSLSMVGGSIGLGFAIPSNQVRRTAAQLIETGSATYPIIGVLLDQRYSGEGVQVSTDVQDGRQPVTADGPAERAGIHPGDVILAIDGRPVTDPDELIVAIRARTPGDTIVLHVRSGSSERDVRVKLDESPTG